MKKILIACCLLGITSLGFANTAGWMSKWADGSPTGAEITSADGAFTVTGNSRKMSYGSVYKKLSVDLDKTPVLNIDVNAVNGFWYIIAKSPKIKGGYVRIQPDTALTGKQTYDLKAITGLSGMQTLQLEVGVSSGKPDPNTGKSMVFKDLQFLGQQGGASIPGAIRVSPWKEKWPDGTATGATLKEDANGLTVTGSAKKQNYGTVYKVVTVNLDKTPVLKITPATATGQWYLEAMGGNLKAPVKIQEDSELMGSQIYDLKSTLGLSGEQSFELHIGVVNPGEASNAGKSVTVKDLSFVSETGGAAESQ